MSAMKAIKAFVTIPLYKEFWIFGVGLLIFLEVLSWLLSGTQYAFEMTDMSRLFVFSTICVTRFKDTYDTPD